MNAKPEPQRIPASEKPAEVDGAAPTPPARNRARKERKEINQLVTPAIVLTIIMLGVAATWSLSAPPEEPSLFVMMYTPGPNWDTTRAPMAQLHFDSIPPISPGSAATASSSRESASVPGD